MTIAFYPALVTHTGDHAAAVVLSQIMYWHQGRLGVTRHGRYWLAKSRAEMCRETGISLDQYKRIMPLLMTRGLIVIERGLFKNKVTPFIRLTEAGSKLMQGVLGEKPSNRLVASASNKLVSFPTNQLVSSATNPCTEITTETTTERTNVQIKRCDEEHVAREREETRSGESLRKENPDQDQLQREEKEQIEYKPEEHSDFFREAPMKAHEILKARQPPETGGLGAYWKSRVATIQNGKYQHPLTGKEAGQLKQLSKYLGPLTKPVIDYAVNHWWTFAGRAAAAAGVSPPADPHIGFLLVHHAMAVELLAPVATPPIAEERVVQPIAPQTESEPAYVPSAQELAKILDGLKSP